MPRRCLAPWPATVPEWRPRVSFIAGHSPNARGNALLQALRDEQLRGQAQALSLVVMLHGARRTRRFCGRGTRMNTLAEEVPVPRAVSVQAPGDNVMKCWKLV